MAYQDRRELYQQIEKERDSKVIAYVTGGRPGLETVMASDAVDYFVHHLDTIGVVDRLSLVLYTRGGETLSAWTIANLLRMFCDRLEVIVPSTCHSAGTLLCLGANNIVMTKQATLGAIDPSVNTPLNPPYPGGNPEARVSVSVEDVNAFIEQARTSLPNQPLESAFDVLANSVHPLVLGTAFRTRAQIRMLGERLLSNHMTDQLKIDSIVDFLCSESGSHDYTINRREAKDALGLPIERPGWELYDSIKNLYDDYVQDLQMRSAFHPQNYIGSDQAVRYSFRRALIESTCAGSHAFVSEGQIVREQVEIQPGVFAESLSDQREQESWRLVDEG